MDGTLVPWGRYYPLYRVTILYVLLYLVPADQSRLAIQRVRPARELCMRIADMVVSLIFVGNSVGSLLAGTSNVFITDLIGYRFVRPPPYYHAPFMWPVADEHRQPHSELYAM